jgi:hypothetical protein
MVRESFPEGETNRVTVGESEIDARRFRRDYLCIFLRLLERMFYYLDHFLAPHAPQRCFYGTWWINRSALSRPISGRFLVMRQSR